MINKLDVEYQEFIKKWKDEYNKAVTPLEDAYEEIKKLRIFILRQNKRKNK